MILRVGGTLVLATLLALAAVTGAHAKGKKPVKATSLAVSMPANATAGEKFAVKLAAVSKQGKVVRDFNGTVTASASASGGTVPGRIKLSRGRATVDGFDFPRAGEVTISFNGKIKGSGRVRIDAGPLAELDLSAPGTATVGQAFGVSAIASDRFGNPVEADTTFSITAPGTCQSASCSAPRAGSYIVSADAGAIHAERTVEVSRGTVAGIDLTAPNSIVAGESFTPTAKAVDQNGNVLEEQTGEIAFSFRAQACDGGSCSTTVSGRQTLTASVDGISIDRGIDVKPGAAKTLSFNSGNGFELALPMPTGANADYSKRYKTPTSLTFSLTAADAYGNYVDAGAAQLSGPGLSCSGLICTASEAGKPTLTARLGDATTGQPIRVPSLDETYDMSCRGENYDLDAQVANGCEFAQPSPGHTTAANAVDLGRFTSCKDGDSRFSFAGTHARDSRYHTGVEGFDDGGANRYRGAPLFWTVQAGSGFCTNDVYLKVEGSSDTAACLTIKVRGADGRVIASDTLPRDGVLEIQAGSGAYRDNETLTFSVESGCWGSGFTNKTDFTVSGHL